MKPRRTDLSFLWILLGTVLVVGILYAANPVIVARPKESSGLERLSYAVAPVLEPLLETGFVIVLVVFMLIKREDLRNRLIGLLGQGHLTGTTRVIMDAAQRLSRYLLTQLA